MNNILKLKLESSKLYGSISTTEIENLKRTINEEINKHNDEIISLCHTDDKPRTKDKLRLHLKDNCKLMVYARDDTPIKLLERVVLNVSWSRWYANTIRKTYNVIAKIEYNKTVGKEVNNG